MNSAPFALSSLRTRPKPPLVYFVPVPLLIEARAQACFAGDFAASLPPRLFRCSGRPEHLAAPGEQALVNVVAVSAHQSPRDGDVLDEQVRVIAANVVGLTSAKGQQS